MRSARADQIHGFTDSRQCLRHSKFFQVLMHLLVIKQVASPQARATPDNCALDRACVWLEAQACHHVLSAPLTCVRSRSGTSCDWLAHHRSDRYIQFATLRITAGGL
jgi:hypothetical protein